MASGLEHGCGLSESTASARRTRGAKSISVRLRHSKVRAGSLSSLASTLISKMTILMLLSFSAVFGNTFSELAAAVTFPKTGRVAERGLPEVEDERDTPVGVLTREDPSDWGDVPLEDEVGESFDWRSTTGRAEEDVPFRRSSGFSKDPPVAELYSRNTVDSPDSTEYLGDNISLEGQIPACQKKKKDATLEQTKRIAATFVLATPTKKQLLLEEKDVLVGRELERFEKQKERRKKKREKLELERLKREQRQKYDSAVDLVEQKVPERSHRFKSMRKLLRYLQRLSEGVS